MAVDELERLPGDRRSGLAVADEDQLGGARRGREAVLAEYRVATGAEPWGDVRSASRPP